MSDSILQTEFEFTLPQGYVDGDGTLHREGVMRLATAADEIKPLRDPRVQSNPSYLTIVLLSRVVASLGTLEDVTPNVIENCFVSDLAYLQDLYERVNTRTADVVDAVCPGCGETFEVEVGSGTESRPTTAGETESLAATTQTPPEATEGTADAIRMESTQSGERPSAGDRDGISLAEIDGPHSTPTEGNR